ncbi:probable G-protein coupled receptor 25 [Osmerus mordax]|uniref:probable G-protein coupled receptor 25 n=1 Tax=Osmerus mordax TaxID=8014 RepID=UPI0035100521
MANYSDDLNYYSDDNYIFDDDIYDYSDDVNCSNQSLPASYIYVPMLYFIFFFIGFVGNLFVILVIGSRGRMGSRLVDTFVVNLALADLVFVLTLPFWAISASQHGHWNFGDISCKLSSYIIAVNRFANIFFLTCMSVDRYLAVVRLMDSRFLRSKVCIHITCAVIWLTSLVMGTPSLIYRKAKIFDYEPFCVDDVSTLFLGLSLTTVFVTFALPVLIILFCYGSVVARIRQPCAATSNPRAEARRRHSLKMVLTIIVFFMVSWLPFNIFKTISICFHLAKDEADLSCSQSVVNQGLVLSSCLAFLNSCVNPAIYFFLDHHFKRKAKNLYLICIRRRGMHQGYNSSNSLTNNFTSESYGTSASRTRLQSLDRKL